MQYVALDFPPRIAFGARSEPAWQTALARVHGGAESTNQDWENNRHYFDVSLAVRTQDDYADVRAHFNVMRGRAKKFRFRDPLDHHTNESGMSESGEDTRQPALALATANHYQATKRYGSGADAYDRKITRLVSPVKVYRTRSAVVTDITGATTIGMDTGEFVVTGHLSGDTYNWTGTFDVPSRYDTDRLPAEIVNKQPAQNAARLYVKAGSIPIVEVRE